MNETVLGGIREPCRGTGFGADVEKRVNYRQVGDKGASELWVWARTEIVELHVDADCAEGGQVEILLRGGK